MEHNGLRAGAREGRQETAWGRRLALALVAVSIVGCAGGDGQGVVAAAGDGTSCPYAVSPRTEVVREATGPRRSFVSDLLFDGSGFVAVGTSAKEDSAEWTAAVWDVGAGSARMVEDLPSGGRTSTIGAAAAAGGVVVAGGSVDCGVGPVPVVWTRHDGVWTPPVPLVDSGGGATVTDVAAGPGGFVALAEPSGASRPMVWVSTDGKAWAPSEVPDAAGLTLTKVASSPQGWILFGAASTPGGWRPAAWVADATGGWRTVAPPAVRVLDAAWIDEAWIAAGAAPTGGQAMSRSTDGAGWEPVGPVDGSPLSSITNVVGAAGGRALALVADGAESLLALAGTKLGPPDGIPRLPRPAGATPPGYSEGGLMAGGGDRVMVGSPRRDGISFAELGPSGWVVHDGAALGAWREGRQIEVREIEGSPVGEVIVLASSDVDPVSGRTGPPAASVWSRAGPDERFQEQFEGSDQVAATTGALYAVQPGGLGVVWSPDGRLWQLSTVFGLPARLSVDHLWADDGGLWIFSAGAGARVFRADAPAGGGEELHFAPVAADVAGVDEVRAQCRADGRTTMVGGRSDPASPAVAVSGDTGGLSASALVAPVGTADPRANGCAVRGATVVVTGTVSEPVPVQGLLLAQAGRRQRAVTWRSTDAGVTWTSTVLPTADDHPATSTNGFAVTTDRDGFVAVGDSTGVDVSGDPARWRSSDDGVTWRIDVTIHDGAGRGAFDAVTNIGGVVSLAGGHGGAAMIWQPGMPNVTPG